MKMLFNYIAAAVFVVISLCVSSGCGSPLTDLISAKETEVNEIADALTSLYESSLCGTASCGTDLSACHSRLKSPTCATTYGGCVDNSMNRNLDFSASVIRSPTATFSTEFREEACWSNALTDTFITQNGGNSEDFGGTTKWRYFGSPTGFYRIYPGVPQETCGSYDPRLRPWYVAATSGPKDVVVVLDSSGSMSTNSRWETATAAVETILDTLTINDHVAIVLFDSSASQLCGGSIACNSLSQATESNIATLKSLLDNEGPGGNTNFQAGLDIAFSIMGSTLEATSNCHKAILFLTDGFVNGGFTGDTLLNHISSKQATLQADTGSSAIIFTFSFSSGADKTLPKAIACGNNGTWSHVEYNVNLREQMGNYYNYFATLRSSASTSVVWVEPYEDASGSGILTTASKAIYDDRFTPPRLLGVVAVDILATDLEDTAADYADLLSALVQRSAQCPSLDLDLCQLSLIRTTTYGSSTFTPTVTEDELLCESTDLDGCVTANAYCADNMQTLTQPPIPTSSETDTTFFGAPRLSYEAEACQDCSTQTSASSRVHPFHLVLMALIASSFFVVLFQ
eukprot:m.111598 g.111598  ORF g.111598 m.111598 type:complete len:571 (+) comp12766_c0_seq1:99-1811(+)